MTHKGINEFYQSAVHYCKIIENIDNKNLKRLLLALLDLYSNALHLPDGELGQDNVTDIAISSPQINFGQYEHYWEVFNPYQLEEPVGASLSDDILDIYKDVKKAYCYTRGTSI
ncbi:DUF5063 domain-containing protein [Bacillus sp. ISL-18]|uniref:DUF5063 domain-containing protein n=1 Tax=Bacillus sp. ISL-18 TaxID=2819118 RepID=UPI001BEC4E49|nr:DUF5063 domain-containing protein [Bacillus sp. ISL-18]MBT2659202.1 DUF5063 domain-containing protein [Bacillus sp. ISL-18]